MLDFCTFSSQVPSVRSAAQRAAVARIGTTASNKRTRGICILASQPEYTPGSSDSLPQPLYARFASLIREIQTGHAKGAIENGVGVRLIDGVAGSIDFDRIRAAALGVRHESGIKVVVLVLKLLCRTNGDGNDSQIGVQNERCRAARLVDS